jgi:ubiquinone/menaquinone biosynthesis C-methylase UbiE
VLILSNKKMAEDLLLELYKGLLQEGLGRTKYTRLAFLMLPRLDKPSILDIGCGPGAPTLELARLSNGDVTGLDIHQPSLEELANKAKEAGLSERIKTINRSMFDLDFPDESFDIIWSEGSIYIIGFERGLKQWRRLIKPHGFLVVHEMVWLNPHPPQEISKYWKANYPGISTVSVKLKLVAKCGYRLLGHFKLPEDVWWVEYYEPLEKRINELRRKYSNDVAALAMLDKEQSEVELFKKYQKWYGSAFFIMQRNNHD